MVTKRIIISLALLNGYFYFYHRIIVCEIIDCEILQRFILIILFFVLGVWEERREGEIAENQGD
jgi:hypothetical protein